MYVLTEMERSLDYDVTILTINNQEEFDNHENAKSKMMEYFHEIVTPSHQEMIVRTEIAENSAMIELNDGNVIEWDIEEVTD